MSLSKPDLHIEFAKAALTGLIVASNHRDMKVISNDAWDFALAMVAAMPPEAKEERLPELMQNFSKGTPSFTAWVALDDCDEIVVNWRYFMSRDYSIRAIENALGRGGLEDAGLLEDILESALSKGAPNA